MSLGKITYGSTTAEIPASGTKTLECANQYMNNKVVITTKADMYDGTVKDFYLTFTPSTGTVSITPSSYWNATTKEYSTDDGITWNAYNSGAVTGNSIKFRGLGGTAGSGDTNGNYSAWSVTGTNVACSGNIETILDYQVVANGQHPAMADSCYSYMFQGCTSLTTAPELPATSLVSYCYRYMFQGCTSLTTAPELPATTLASYCYNYMFSGCTSLTTAPELPATTLADSCYGNMFRGCTALYVSDSTGSSYNKAWRIPTTGTFTNTYSQSSMFTSCLGTRSSNHMAGAAGQSYTYYTQNNPV